jgi:ATP-dependent RNA helicase DDX51/DBP6
MFGARYDPSGSFASTKSNISIDEILSRKRRLSASDSDGDSGDEEDNKNHSENESESDSENDNENDSENDSDSSSENDTSNSESLSDSSNESESDDDSESDSESDNESDNSKSQGQVDTESTIHNISTTESPHQVVSMDVDVVANDKDYVAKHQGIFTKLKKVSDLQKTTSEVDNDVEMENADDVEKRDLEPLPQPALPRDKRLNSNSTHLKNLNWLASPIYSLPDETQPFEEFGLSGFMMKNLASQRFEKAFSVQIAVLNLMMKDQLRNKLRPDIAGDILVNASTGSGKTLAYSIPIIEALHARTVPRVRAIILVPTKPLINQVKTTLVQLSKGTSLNIASLKNDISIKEEGEKLLDNPPDIIVSTPGRLVDHITNESVDLNSLRYLVIDEADRLLNQSFQNWANVLISRLPAPVNISEKWRIPVQKLIFSATLTTDAGKLSVLNFVKPRLIIVNREKELVNELFSVPATLSEYKIRLGSAKSTIKPLILAKYIILTNKLFNVLIFTKSNEASLRLSKLLEMMMRKLTNQDINVGYINSTNNKTMVRKKILQQFAVQKVNIIVATDLIARGIDILSITDIINYDMPNSSREYVHRVGRTARANQEGNAYNFVFGKGEDKWFTSLMKDIGRGGKDINDVDVSLAELVTNEDEQVFKQCLQALQDQITSKK